MVTASSPARPSPILEAAGRRSSAFGPYHRRRALVDRQFWLWGQDIRRPEGNLLVEYGFARRRPPTGQVGSSAYDLCLTDGARIDLWGFGILYRTPDSPGLYLVRSRPTPMLIEPAAVPGHVWEPAQLAAATKPATAERKVARRRFAALASWIAAYERWVAATAGLDYRRRCLAARSRVVVPGEHLAAAWLAVATWAAEMSLEEGEDEA